MSHRSVFLGNIVLAALFVSAPLRAQYLYMDSNGDGIHDSGDRMNKKGSTSVDLYLVTDANRDGSAAACDNNDYPGTPATGIPLTLFSYGLAFKAVGGTVAWSGPTRIPSGFTFFYTAYTSDTEYHFFCGQTPPIAPVGPGRIYLGRLEVEAMSGRPSLEFEPVITRPDGFYDWTSFGTPCLGLDYDNTYKLGSDFLDADGLAAAGAPHDKAGPGRVSLSPNPMNPTGTLSFATERPGRVTARIFDLHGRLVRTLIAGAWMDAGRHEMVVDGRSDGGEPLRSGVYFYEVKCADGPLAGRLVVHR